MSCWWLEFFGGGVDPRNTLPPMVQWKMGVSPIFVSFHLGWFSTSMIMGERVGFREHTFISQTQWTKLGEFCRVVDSKSWAFLGKNSCISGRFLKDWNRIHLWMMWRISCKFHFYFTLGSGIMLGNSNKFFFFKEGNHGQWLPKTKNPLRR